MAVQRCVGSFHDPAAEDDFEALGRIGALNDLDGPLANATQRIAEFVPGIAAVGDQVPRPRGSGRRDEWRVASILVTLPLSGNNQGSTSAKMTQ